MMGEARGRLAVTLDVLTDALILVGQHGVYCTSARNPNVPALDVQAVLANIHGAKELVGSVVGRRRSGKEAARGGGFGWGRYGFFGGVPFYVALGAVALGIFK